MDFLQGGSWTGGEIFVERFVLPAAVQWDTSQTPHTYGTCCLSCSENKTQSVSGFVRTGKCLLSAKKISTIFPASILQKAGCRRAAAQLLLGPRGDRENQRCYTEPRSNAGNYEDQRLCSICDIRLRRAERDEFLYFLLYTV